MGEFGDTRTSMADRHLEACYRWAGLHLFCRKIGSMIASLYQFCFRLLHGGHMYS